jgi:hypothetical protein
MSRDFGLLPIPSHLQYHPEKTRTFGLTTNLIFSLAAAFTGIPHPALVSMDAGLTNTQRPTSTTANPSSVSFVERTTAL